MKISTVVARILTVGVLVALAGSATAQQTYPNKPIRFISPNPPGGGTSLTARLIGQKLTESWGQQVLVENRPGGNSIIGTEALVKSRPDGYTILIVAGTFVTNPSMFSYLPYDPVKDFAPITTVSRNPYFLALHPSLPANNLQEFIALAKSRRGQLNYAGSGTGSPPHLAGALFEMMTGTKMQFIPYKGAGQILPDLIGGQVQLSFLSPQNAITHIETGQLKGIAMTGEARLPAAPQVPTFAEAGLPGFELTSWYGVLAPAGTPKEIIDKLSTGIGTILRMPDVRKNLASRGMEPYFSTPDQFAAIIKADIAKFAKIIKTANIKRKE